MESIEPPSRLEGVAAPTGGYGVGVMERESAASKVVHEVDGGPVQVRHGGLIDEDAQVPKGKGLIGFGGPVGQGQVVLEAGASASDYGNPKPTSVLGFGLNELLDCLRRLIGQLNQRNLPE